MAVDVAECSDRFTVLNRHFNQSVRRQTGQTRRANRDDPAVRVAIESLIPDAPHQLPFGEQRCTLARIGEVAIGRQLDRSGAGRWHGDWETVIGCRRFGEIRRNRVEDDLTPGDLDVGRRGHAEPDRQAGRRQSRLGIHHD